MLIDPPAVDIEAIERATVAAVAPRSIEELPGWLLPFEPGAVGRAKSAVPLRHTESRELLKALPTIAARYATHAAQLSLRIADVPALAQVQAALNAQGLSPARPTFMQLTAARTLAQTLYAGTATVSSTCDPAWRELFLNREPEDQEGAHRLELLARNSRTFYASIRDGERIVAVGAVSFGFGCACVHGMRTHPDRRGEGLAAQILGSIGQAACAHGIDHVCLQVETTNAAALALYRRAGFTNCWQYSYWQCY